MFAVLEFSDFLIIALVVAFVIGVGLSVYRTPRERARLARVEAKVDLLLKHAGLVYDAKAAAPPAVLDALQRGNKIEAIRLYREASGVGLEEAKVFVEDLQAGAKP